MTVALDKKQLWREINREERQRARARLRALRDELREARARRQYALREAKERCRTERLAAQERARALRLRTAGHRVLAQVPRVPVHAQSVRSGACPRPVARPRTFVRASGLHGHPSWTEAVMSTDG